MDRPDVSGAVENENNSSQRLAPHPWLGLIVGMLAILALTSSTFVLLYGFIQTRPVDLRATSLSTFDTVERFLLTQQIPPDAIRQTDLEARTSPKLLSYYTSYEVDLPPTLSPDGLKLLLDRRLRDAHVRVTEAAHHDGITGLQIAYGDQVFASLRLRTSKPVEQPMRQEPTTTLPDDAPPAPPDVVAPMTDFPDVTAESDLENIAMQPIPSPTAVMAHIATPVTATIPVVNPIRVQKRPRLAIIIDDGGYGGPHTESILSLDPQLTLSILPNTPFGRNLAKRATGLGFEVMLHMPMENLSARLTHQGEITTAMNTDRIAELTQDALRQVPGAKGVNNHTGSKFTRDTEALTLFMTAIRDEGLYFIDSRTTPSTQGLKVARAMSIPSAQRDLFLDHDNNIDAIRARFAEVLDLAEQQGQAIAICHFRPNTAQVLGEMLPELHLRGIDLVHASEFVR